MWSTKIERVIDLREKMNQVFYYPIRPINDRKNLIDVLIVLLRKEQLQLMMLDKVMNLNLHFQQLRLVILV